MQRPTSGQLESACEPKESGLSPGANRGSRSPQFPLMELARVSRLTVELHGRRPLSGRLEDSTGVAREFQSTLELIQLLEDRPGARQPRRQGEAVVAPTETSPLPEPRG